MPPNTTIIAMNTSELAAKIATLEIWAQVCGVLVAIGIVGEVAMGIRLLILNKLLQRQTSSELVEAQTNASNALARAESAERKLADRHLSQKDQAIMIERLKPLPKLPIAVYFISDGEPAPFTSEIVGVFREAGFKPILNAFQIPAGFPRGVSVFDQTKGSHKQLADEVIAAFNSVGVLAVPIDRTYGPPVDAAAAVFIGQK